MADDSNDMFEVRTADAEDIKRHVEEAIEEDAITAFILASAIMEKFEPSFVIIGSPQLGVSDAGYTFPLELGLLMNDELNITRSDMASILFNIGNSLAKDMNSVLNFVKEAAGENNDSA